MESYNPYHRMGSSKLKSFQIQKEGKLKMCVMYKTRYSLVRQGNCNLVKSKEKTKSKKGVSYNLLHYARRLI